MHVLDYLGDPKCEKKPEDSLYAEYRLLCSGTLHHRCLDLCRRGQDKDMAKTFTLEMAQRAPQLLALVADDVCPKGALRTLAVALLTELLGQVEHNGHWQTVILTRQRHERLARLCLHIRGIHNRFCCTRPSPGRISWNGSVKPGPTRVRWEFLNRST